MAVQAMHDMHAMPPSRPALTPGSRVGPHVPSSHLPPVVYIQPVLCRIVRFWCCAPLRSCLLRERRRHRAVACSWTLRCQPPPWRAVVPVRCRLHGRRRHSSCQASSLRAASASGRHAGAAPITSHGVLDGPQWSPCPGARTACCGPHFHTRRSIRAHAQRLLRPHSTCQQQPATQQRPGHGHQQVPVAMTPGAALPAQPDHHRPRPWWWWHRRRSRSISHGGMAAVVLMLLGQRPPGLHPACQEAVTLLCWAISTHHLRRPCSRRDMTVSHCANGTYRWS